MPDQRQEPKCPRCGEPAAGKFCAGCGAALHGVKCPSCGHAVSPGARFCPECGAPCSATAGAGGGGRSRADRLPWLIGGAAVLILAAFVAGELTARRSIGPVVATEDAPPVPLGATPAAPDISSMSPDERASRLFNRVMLYSEQGKPDSVRFFAPMAIQAYLMLGPLDAHSRYDIGVISAVAGDLTRARAEADTIIAANPNHLLGLALEMRVAEMMRDTRAAGTFARRLVAAAPTERSAARKEYQDHARDIDEALKKATSATR